MVDTSAPILILQQRVLYRRNLSVLAVTAYGRVISAVVPFLESTAEGIDRALRLAWSEQIEADEAKRAALTSFEQEMRDGYALDDPDPDPTVG